MLSIIIPCYNVSEFIDEALVSLLRQPFSINIDFEIICVDDCSKDKTIVRLQEYEKLGVRVISLERNAGVSHARNVGLKNAQGDFVWFFDGDDIASPDSMQKIFNCITSEKCIDAIRFQASYVKEQSKIENILTTNQKPTKDNLYCFVINRTFLSKKNISFCEKMTYSEDVAFISLCYINEMRIADISNTLYYYRQRSTSLMHDRDDIKYFTSICQLPYYYNDYKLSNWLVLSDDQQHELQELIYDASQACLMHAVKRTSCELKDVVNNLIHAGLYPFPVRYNLLSIRHGLLAAIAKSRYILLPFYSYLLFFNRFTAGKRRF